MDILIHDPKKNKRVLCGEFDEKTKTFYKEAKASHWCRAAQGFGISLNAMEQLKGLGCQKIIVRYGREVRAVPFSVWDAKSPRSLGQEKQVFMPWSGMSVVSAEQMSFL